MKREQSDRWGKYLILQAEEKLLERRASVAVPVLAALLAHGYDPQKATGLAVKVADLLLEGLTITAQRKEAP